MSHMAAWIAGSSARIDLATRSTMSGRLCRVSGVNQRSSVEGMMVAMPSRRAVAALARASLRSSSEKLAAERGRGCRPAQDNRCFLEGMMWMARMGSQWRQLPDEYGKWNSVFRRYRRWATTGVFDAMLETLAGVVERDASADMIDSTIVRAHHCAVGTKRGSAGRGARPLARRLHHQAPRPVRRSRPPTRLCSDAWTGARRPGLRPAHARDRRPDRCSAGRQRL